MGTDWDSLKQQEGALLIDKILELQETMHVIWSNLISQRRRQTHRVKFRAAQLNLAENQVKSRLYKLKAGAFFPTACSS